MATTNRYSAACKECTGLREKELKHKRGEYDPVLAAHRERERRGIKLCPKCGEEKSLDEFKARLVGEGKFKAYCISCEKAYLKDYQADHFETRRAHRREREYGLENGEFDRLMLCQDEKCAACQDPIGPDCHVDHDHATGIVRGLLCGPCNPALGHLKDDPSRTARLLEYLERS